ncbi:MAG: DUF3035 domain-containing protein [Paracoccaceae bacterium]
MWRATFASGHLQIALFGVAALLAGCSINSEDGGIGQQLGIAAGTPDEFMIIARDPLQMPPNFSLPTPRPGAPSLVEPDPYAAAHETLFNRREPVRSAAAGGGEVALLGGAGATGDNSAVREELAEDNAPGERQFGLTSFLGMKIPANLNDPDALVESTEENDRLRREGLLTPTAPPPEEERKPLKLEESEVMR